VSGSRSSSEVVGKVLSKLPVAAVVSAGKTLGAAPAAAAAAAAVNVI
jgi:hypothetical protein